MSSPEGRGSHLGQPIEIPQSSKEREHELYYMAARFPDYPAANASYKQVQDVLSSDKQCELSAYNVRLNQVCHVAVAGEPPSAQTDQILRAIFSTGEITFLPLDILNLLRNRRKQMTKHAEWVECNYRPGIPLGEEDT